PGLEWSYSQSGIPRMPPRKLALTFLRLPPILYKLYNHSISDYSKAPRGLPVLPRVLRIFTHSIISPGLSSSQSSSRCIVRAGRNLPDKAFRYRTTVIVTAAVYGGVDAVLRTEVLTHPLNLPAPGRCQPLYVALRLRRDLCF